MKLKSVSVKTRLCSEIVRRRDQQWVDRRYDDGRMTPVFICTDRSQNIGGACPGDEGGELKRVHVVFLCRATWAAGHLQTLMLWVTC